VPLQNYDSLFVRLSFCIVCKKSTDHCGRDIPYILDELYVRWFTFFIFLIVDLLLALRFVFISFVACTLYFAAPFFLSIFFQFILIMCIFLVCM